MASDNLTALPWRTGRKIGRTIYAQRGPGPCDEDPLIGTLDTAGLAAEAVSAHNAVLAMQRPGPDGSGLPRGVYELADEAFEGWRKGSGPRDELEAALLAAAPLIRAAERDRIAELAADRNATYPVHERPGLITGHLPFEDLIREEPRRG